MKMTRKLIPAIAMLLVSAVMMSTASFAWFTMNSTVQATGMTVTAVAPASLWISQDGSTWVSAITFANEVVDNTETTDVNEGAPAQFKPVTPKTQTTFDAWTFKQLTDAASTRVEADGTIDNLAESDYVDSYSFFKDQFKLQLQSTAGDTAPLSAQVKVSTTASTPDEIWRALRVAIVTEGQTLTFAFDDDATTDAKPDKYDEYTDAQTFTAKIVAGGADTNVVVYAWFEGNDLDCKNANALNTTNFTIEVKFDIGDVETPAPGND